MSNFPNNTYLKKILMYRNACDLDLFSVVMNDQLNSKNKHSNRRHN